MAARKRYTVEQIIAGIADRHHQPAVRRVDEDLSIRGWHCRCSTVSPGTHSIETESESWRFKHSLDPSKRSAEKAAGWRSSRSDIDQKRKELTAGGTNSDRPRWGQRRLPQPRDHSGCFFMPTTTVRKDYYSRLI